MVVVVNSCVSRIAVVLFFQDVQNCNRYETEIKIQIKIHFTST